MVVTLSDGAGSIELFQAQSLANETEGSVDVSPPPGFDSDTPFLTSLEQSGRATLQGVATGPRLSRDPDYNSDPLTALAEWAVAFESFVNGAQGDGYTLSRDYRNDSFNGYVETGSWTRRGGEKLELGWSMTFIRGQGAGPKNARTTQPVSPGGDYKLDGQKLEGITEVQVEKQQGVNVARRSAQAGLSPDDNDLFSDEGATRTVRVTGRVPGDEATRNSFDATITDSIGQDEIVTFRDAFTGRTFDGMIRNFDATDEAGITRLGDYAVEFVEGEK